MDLSKEDTEEIVKYVLDDITEKISLDYSLRSQNFVKATNNEHKKNIIIFEDDECTAASPDFGDISVIHSPDENLCDKDSNVNVLDSQNNSHSEMNKPFELDKFHIITSTPENRENPLPFMFISTNDPNASGCETLMEHKDECNNNKSLDEIIENAINKYEKSETKEVKKFREVSVQTFHSYPTLVSHCDCDKYKTYDDTKEPPSKMTKLKDCDSSCESREMIWMAKEPGPSDGIKESSFDNQQDHCSPMKMPSGNLKSVPRLRLGLSKRMKCRSLHYF